MKKTFAMLFMAVALSATAVAKDIKTIVLTPSPAMSCENCENKIKGNLRFEKGVKEVKTDLKNQEVVIVYDADKNSEEAIVSSFSKFGYSAVKKGDLQKSGECKEKVKCAENVGRIKGDKREFKRETREEAAKRLEKANGKLCPSAKKECGKTECETPKAKECCDVKALKDCEKKDCDKKDCDKKECDGSKKVCKKECEAEKGLKVKKAELKAKKLELKNKSVELKKKAQEVKKAEKAK